MVGDRTPRRSLLGSVTAALVGAGLLLASCGESETAQTERPPRAEQPATPPQDPASPPSSGSAPRDGFSVETGQVCRRFYGLAAPLQFELKSVGPRARRDPRARRRTRAIITELQTRSREFGSDIEATPAPSTPARRADKARLLASTERFVRLQRDNLDLAENLIFDSSPPSAAEQRRAIQLRSELGAEITEQQAILRRLDVPECLPG